MWGAWGSVGGWLSIPCRVLCDRVGNLIFRASYSRAAREKCLPIIIGTCFAPAYDCPCMPWGFNDFRKRAVCILSLLAAANTRLLRVRREPAISSIAQGYRPDATGPPDSRGRLSLHGLWWGVESVLDRPAAFTSFPQGLKLFLV